MNTLMIIFEWVNLVLAVGSVIVNVVYFIRFRHSRIRWAKLSAAVNCFVIAWVYICILINHPVHPLVLRTGITLTLLTLFSWGVLGFQKEIFARRKETNMRKEIQKLKNDRIIK